MEGVEFREGTLWHDGWQGVLTWWEKKGRAATGVLGRGVLGGLIVGLNRGQFIDELFTAVELAEARRWSFPRLSSGVLVIHDIWPSRIHSVLLSACNSNAYSSSHLL